jgi:hypothetical protein
MIYFVITLSCGCNEIYSPQKDIYFTKCVSFCNDYILLQHVSLVFASVICSCTAPEVLFREREREREREAGSQAGREGWNGRGGRDRQRPRQSQRKKKQKQSRHKRHRHTDTQTVAHIHTYTQTHAYRPSCSGSLSIKCRRSPLIVVAHAGIRC